MRLIAFYLPQFHPIPEKDAGWEPGFTEWTSVASARPLFPGHEQPDLPGELGFYDLRVPEVRRAQADLARQHGIHGFCYDHYWFHGRLLMERPLEEVLASGEPDFPFCLNWVNGNWTKGDSGDEGVLIRQEYSEADDREHFRWLARALRDPRYIRVGSRPLLLINDISSLPDPSRTAALWREEARAHGIQNPFLCGVESLRGHRIDPNAVGFDAAVESQPDWRHAGTPELETPEGNRVFEYRTLIEGQLRKPRPAYLRFPCVSPHWDDSPRRQQDALIVRGSHPDLFQRWLEATLEQRSPLDPELDFVFIRSWNQWTEGAKLEPSRRWGRGYLEATRKAVKSVAARAAERERGLVSSTGAAAAGRSAITVCIPTFNGARYIAATLQSVLGQTLADIEVVVVDDASADETLEIVRSFRDPRLSVRVNSVRLGIAGNWNRCLEYASTPFVCVFHQDDLMMPTNLAQKVAFLGSHPRAGMVFSNVWQIGPSDEVISQCWYSPPDPADQGLHAGDEFFRRLLLGPNIVCCPSVVARREVFDVVGGFDASMPFTLDWEMWLRIASRYAVGYLTEALVRYRRHPDMETNRFVGMGELEHGLDAMLAALDRARGLFPDAAVLREKVAVSYRSQALERAARCLREGRRDEAAPYLAFALRSDYRTGMSSSPEDAVGRLLAETVSLDAVTTAHSGAPAGTSQGQIAETAALTATVDEPRPLAEVQGDLVVRGWARIPGEDLSLWFAIDGASRTPSSFRRFPRPDVAQAYPHLGDISAAGFEARFAAATESRGERTLRVTFCSRDGRTGQAPPIAFRWIGRS
jgi:hypothetical protein